ncbi:MAG: 5'-nucleotidase C-terminal domain-containing protein, partial [Solirubrobacterales bacterium]|nr:5'-nucleotidase C-terminal domain-containing protein [Solirubrobacterales bacterium]
GADFKYLSANVKLKEPTPYRSTFFDATKIKSFAGGRVGFIGLTLEDTPTIVSASGIRDVEFRDEAETINHLVGYLHSKGVKTIVVLIHEGGLPTGTYNECPGISGPIVDIVKNTDPEVDLFITGHTHQAYNCLIDGRPVTSASSNGRLITDVDMTIDKRTQQPTKIAVNNKIVTRDVPKDAGETNLIAKYQTFAAPIANRVVGSNTADITRTPSAAGEQPLGDVIADSQLASTAGPAGAQIAFMNPGGIRADLTYASSPAGEGDGIITYGEVFTIQPFGNVLTTLTLTGAQIEQVLEQQWGGSQPAEGRILQVSKGFTYTWDASKAPGDRIDPASIKLDGTTVDPGASYRVTVNNFLADGGDNFTALKAGTDRQGGQVDVDAFEAYIKAHSPISPPPLDRITTVP